MSERKSDQRKMNLPSTIVPGAGGAVGAFAWANQKWIRAAVKSGALGTWSDQDFRVLEGMAGPAGIEEYARLLDLALNSWPSASRLSDVSLEKLSSLVGRSKLFDSRIEQMARAMPAALANADSQQLQTIANFHVTPEIQEKAEQEISQQIQQNADAHSLSSVARDYLVWLLWLMLLVMNYLAMQNAVRSELCFFVPKAMPTMTASSYGKVVRAVMCEAALPAVEFSRYRIVKGEGVRLRNDPGMKSELIALSLQDSDLLEVLDDSNRDWLYVSVVNEGGITGWISRKYTHRLNR